MKISVSMEKQIIIMAQSSMRLAVDVAISLNKQEDIKFIQDTANKFMKIETALAGINIEPLKELTKNSRKSDLIQLRKKVKDKNTLQEFWKQLTEDEQIEYKTYYETQIKKYAIR